VSRIVLVGGGVRSGKSAFALARARALGVRRAFVATAQPSDEEMRERIARHRKERGDGFVTIEEPLAVSERIAAARGVDVVLVDCLTLWLSNLLLRGDGEKQALAAVEGLVRAMLEAPFATVVVSNEVGMGLVPESPLGRLFRDVSGHAHRLVAARASEIYFATMGCILRLRPGPVALEDATVATLPR
jgi:adenosylcobinamide kinase / adenosylcobinamide-phosphate guanylyltransferase